MRLLAGDNQAKAWLIPNDPVLTSVEIGKAVRREESGPIPIS